MILLAITTNNDEIILCDIGADRPIRATIAGLMSVHNGKAIEIIGVYL